MAINRYDVIVVGARCAGSPTAMLLARKGYKVLVVDRATFPSDTLSTHLLHPPGIASLRRWGLLERLVATGCPPIHTYTFDFGPFTLSGTPGTDQTPVAYAPRRTVLDKLLLDAAAQAGAEVREGFTVQDLILDRPGGHRHPRPRRCRRHRHRARPGGRRRRRPPLPGRPRRAARALPPAAPAAGELLQLLERAPHGGPLRDLHPPPPRLRRLAHPPRPHPGHRRLALCRVPRQQARHRSHLPQDAGAGPGLRRPRPRRTTRGPLCRHRGAELLPQALWAGVGAGRRRRLHQGLHHRPGHARRLPRRRALRHRPGRDIHRRQRLRDRHGRLPGHPRHPGPPHVQAHHPARHPPAPTPRPPATARGHPRQPASDGRLRPQSSPASPPPPTSSPRTTSGGSPCRPEQRHLPDAMSLYHFGSNRSCSSCEPLERRFL